MRNAWLFTLSVLVGCFRPVAPAGAPCGTSGECPSGLECVAGFCISEVPDAGGALVTVGFVSGASLEDEASGTIQIPVTLSSPSTSEVTVHYYSVTGATATRNDDYTVTDGTLTFAPGETEQAIELTILADAIEEPDETIEFALDSPMGGELGASAHTVTISSNILPRVSFTTATSSTNESTTTVIDVGLDRAATVPITVDFTLAGTATAPDHGLVTGTLTFPVGTTTQQLVIAEVDDALDEDDETLIVTLTNPTNVAIGAIDARTHTIVDNDAMPTVAFTMSASSIAEGGTSIVLDVVLSAPSGRTVTVPFSAPTGTALAPDDFTVVTTGPLEFPAGTVSQPIMVTIVGDLVDENDEGLAITLGTPTNASLGGSPTYALTILDDDAPTCFGTGSYAVCISPIPTVAITLPATLDTDTSPLCETTQPMGWTMTQRVSCFVAGGSIMMGTTLVTGSRPLVLVATDSITVSGTLDVASHLGGTTGPSAPSISCRVFPTTPQAGNGGGGGAGASYMSKGGNGGSGNAGTVAGGTSALANATAPTFLRAGCNGQSGGDGNGNPAGAPGRGGGAVYLVAGNTITIPGVINASGSAATGGAFFSGGTGAGSGGMIKLHATTINATGTLLANGGGGSGGGDSDQLGNAGVDPSPGAPFTRAAGGTGGGGFGGAGFAGALAALNGANDTAGEGGGGGGGGGGLIQSNLALPDAMVSAGLIQAP